MKGLIITVRIRLILIMDYMKITC